MVFPKWDHQKEQLQRCGCFLICGASKIATIAILGQLHNLVEVLKKRAKSLTRVVRCTLTFEETRQTLFKPDGQDLKLDFLASQAGSR